MHRYVGELVKVAWGWVDGSIGKVLIIQGGELQFGSPVTK